MSLKQILQKAVIYPAIIGSLFLGAYRCGNDIEPNPDPSEDAQVQVDTGHDKDMGLEDKLVYPDANGDKEKPDTDVKDGGVDTGDVDLTDVPYVDGGDVDIADTYNPDGGDVILTDTYIQPDGGDDIIDGGDAGQVKAVLKYLVNQYSSNPADYQYEPREINIKVDDIIAYSSCDSTGEDIARYRFTSTFNNIDNISPKSNCLIGKVFYTKKGNFTNTLQAINNNEEPIGMEDSLITNVE